MERLNKKKFLDFIREQLKKEPEKIVKRENFSTGHVYFVFEDIVFHQWKNGGEMFYSVYIDKNGKKEIIFENPVADELFKIVDMYYLLPESSQICSIWKNLKK